MKKTVRWKNLIIIAIIINLENSITKNSKQYQSILYETYVKRYTSFVQKKTKQLRFL